MRDLAIALVLLAGCAVQRPVAQPLAEARYFHAEDALANASDRMARAILARIPGEGPLILALSPVFNERQVRLFRAFLFAGLAAGRDVRLLPHAKATGPNPGLPVVEIVLLAAGSELLAERPPAGVPESGVLHVSALVRVHDGRGALLWSDILHEAERELPLPREEGQKP